MKRNEITFIAMLLFVGLPSIIMVLSGNPKISTFGLIYFLFGLPIMNILFESKGEQKRG